MNEMGGGRLGGGEPARGETGGTEPARGQAQGRTLSDPRSLLPAFLAGAVALGLCVITLLPGVAFWDTGEFQTVGPLLGTAHPTGFPSYVILGWLASIVLQPFGEPAFRMNLLSAICVGVAAGLTALLVRQLTGRGLLGLASGILLATLPVAWSIGTHADPHALHLVFVALLLVLLVDWERLRRDSRPDLGGSRPDLAASRTADRRLVTAAVVYGLSLGNHELTLLLAPGIGLFVLAVEPRIVFRPRFLGVCLVALLATAALVYLELPIRAGILRAPLVYAHPETLGGFLYVVLAQQFQGSLVSPLADLGQKLADLWAFAGVQLGPLAWLVPIGFAATALRRPRYALLTGPTFVITCWFTASYQNAEIDRYYLGPALIAISWAAIATGALVDAMVAMAARLSRGSEARGVVFAAVVGIALLYPSLLDLNDRRKEVDASSNRAAAQWLDAVLDPAVIEPNAVVLSWWSYSTPLWYAQRVEGRRPDIEIVDDRTRLDENLGEVSDVIDANLGRRPVVVIEQDPNLLAGLSARYRLTRLVPSSGQPIYRIDGVLAEVGR